MTIIVFAGPSLPPAARPAGPFEWRGPAVAGDLLSLLDHAPARLCLIDGLFETSPAVWHKELLMLMAQGTAVFGAASMGALRAAELHSLGMIGVGAAFEAYRRGCIEGDDEVALIHATAELDWIPLSVPMIEVRATLLAACREGLLDIPTARRIRAVAHDIFFADRDWSAIGSASATEGLLDSSSFARIAAMHVPLKLMDALACLSMALEWDRPAPAAAPPPVTCFVRELRDQIRARGADGALDVR